VSNISKQMVSLLPEISLAKIQDLPGFDQLEAQEVEALATADSEGMVSNQRLQQSSMIHASDITKMLQGLVAKGFLIKDNYGRWATYRLTANDSSIPSNSIHSEENSIHSEENSIQNAELLEIAAPSRSKRRISKEETRNIIRRLCLNRYLTLSQIGTLLNRDSVAVRNRFVRAMLNDKELLQRYAELNHPQQAYTTNPDFSAE